MSTLSNKYKFGPQRNGMTHEQWRASRRVRSGARMFFERGMGKPGVNCTAQNQTTYNVGRNKAKREARAALKARASHRANRA